MAKSGCGNQVASFVTLGFVVFILWAIAMPNINRVPGKAKEAEVKQNLHAIQLALERYAVDSGSGYFPPAIMGGDWTDSYTVWEDWAEYHDLDKDEITKYMIEGSWIAAGNGSGDALIMESYMPQYPGNPFKKTKAQSFLPKITHLGMTADGSPLLERYVGGRDSTAMYEVFGPTRMQPGQAIQGDYFVHHIFNNPAYDAYTDVRKEINVDWNNPSGNSILVGNFSYFIRPENVKAAWSVLKSDLTVAGYTLAGYGSHRTPGQDVYNRNGNYKGRYRTEPCGFDCGTYELFGDDIPCICDGDTAIANPLQNNGGSDTLADGVVITLDSGVGKKTGRVNFQITEGE